MSKPVKIILIVAGCVALLGFWTVYGGTRGMNEVKNTALPVINPGAMANGDYEGSCSIGRWAMKVRVTVQDRRIVNVVFVDGKHANMTDGLLAEVNKRVISEQALTIDAVGGSTITTRAYMIAVGDALSGK